VVKAVANHLHIFDDSIGSTATINCKGVAKLEAVKRITGKAGISYIGNSLADMPLWKQSSTAYVVSDSKALIANQTMRTRTCYYQSSSNSSMVKKSVAFFASYSGPYQHRYS
jgi:phosphoserine phosphatase